MSEPKEDMCPNCGIPVEVETEQENDSENQIQHLHLNCPDCGWTESESEAVTV